MDRSGLTKATNEEKSIKGERERKEEEEEFFLYS
jgi:hypothetical protein